LTEREKEILELIKNNPMIPQQNIANQLGIKRSSVAVHISNLTRKGYIKGKGYIFDKEKYVVVIGGSNMDIAGFCSSEIIGNDSNPGQVKLSFGGVGRNIAENLVKLGVETKLISIVGNDFYGKRISEDCLKVGIDISLLKMVSDQRTSVYLSIIENNGDMNVAISDMDIINHLDETYLNKHASIIKNASAVVVDTNLSKEVLEMIAENFGKHLFLDTVSTTKTKKVKECLHLFHTIKPNRWEAEILTGFPLDTQKNIQKAVKYFIDLGVQQVFISFGKEGVAFGTQKQFDFFKPSPVKSVNETGAGDAFMSGLVYGYLNKLDITETVRFATTASALTIENENTINPELSVKNINRKLRNKS